MKGLTIAFLAALLIFAAFIVPGYLPEERDVVIIGAGAAGMQAALECREKTEKVVILEKMPYPGGNSARATAGLNAAASEEDVVLYAGDTAAAGRHGGQENLIHIMVTGSRSALTRLREIGADLSDRGLLAGHRTPRTYRPSGGLPVGREITSILYSELQRQGIEVRTENRALRIDREGGVFLVRVENRTGRISTLKAKAVIIATGGFGGDAEKVVRFNPGLKGFNTTNSPGTSGDYLTLTEGLDVKLLHLEDIQTHPTVEPDFGILITEALRGNGGILINSQGHRFTDEMDFREILSRSILEQKEGGAWLIFDREVRESLKSSEYYFQLQLVREAEGLEELAETLSLSSSDLRRTVEKWNSAVTRGKDADFGREDLSRRLETPPFYAIKVAPGVHYCMGGIAIDGEARVLDSQGNPIPGLYAAGEATGGIHGRDRLGGNSLTDALVFGGIAGRQAGLFCRED